MTGPLALASRDFELSIAPLQVLDRQIRYLGAPRGGLDALPVGSLNWADEKGALRGAMGVRSHHEFFER
jgi:hypothetical protein